MREKDVPQDPSFYRGGIRACYAVDEKGRYVVAGSRGFEPETLATALAMDDLRRERDALLARIRAGELSPLAWHMAHRLMTPALLARHVGFFRFRVKRHLRAEVFRSLPERVLARYAEALATDVATLRTVPDSGADEESR